ncbi:TetR/AcrR family transcriptional regulator [Singulisphaera acidiphila]|uniref:Transcriptional regulator n=1 Tax=Singulisphaera acidiphila (strain ATCC BAA-1392 / DSM 18658 / VKM B-2454 / MOB10) TaxID=886293 RepID=L0DEI1_SINAD|nr:TetR/AcrR family transcriptional regulator [Singulisphaera acidiphila]AGA27066.1 transcriptional regulator [Singulisphaera acidiphila DSM 18658]
MTERRGKEAPKRRNSAATRSAILASATRHFVAKGYEHAGVREIATEAGVDGALVNRYFGSKEGLFAEVVAHAFDIRNLIDGERSTLAERLARLMVYGRQDASDDGRTPLLLLLRAATEPRAAELLRTSLNVHNLQVLGERLGGPDAETRAAIVVAQLTGFAILDQMIRPEALAEADRERLVDFLAESLAVCIR